MNLNRLLGLLVAIFCAGLGTHLGLWHLHPKCGDLEVSSEPPAASVFLDQRFQGVTPRTLTRVPRGEHHLRLAHTGHQDEVRAVVVDRRRAAIHFSLRPVPPTGSLVVSSEPTGALVWLDGERFQSTPSRIGSIPPGPHTLKVERMGWLTHQVTIEICGGKEEVVFVKLVSAKVAYYLDAIKRAPDDPTNYFELARVYALSGNVDEAFDMLHKALLACGSPDSPGSPFGKGFGEVLATVRDLEPNLRSERWNNLASLLVKAGGAEQSPHKLADTIHTFFLELGRWQEIVELATSCLAKAQPSPLYHVWRLHAAGKIGDQDQFRRDFEAIIKKPIDAGGYGIAPLLRPVLVELGKWEEVAQVADFCVRRAPANDPYHQADTFSLWELEAFVKLKDWQRVSRAFDALVQQGILSRLTAPCPSEGPMFCAYQQTVLWMGAWAKMELAESQGLEALLQQYETDKERHYWVSLIRGEIWLRKPENHPPKPYLYALPCDQSPQIDGRLKDAVWARAGRSSEFYDYNSANRSSNQTTLLALYDAQCVYLGVECTVPEGERGADGAAGTAIEVFLDADRDYTTYTQIMLSPRGTPAGNACVKEPFCGKFDISPYWSPDYRVAAAPEETSWCFELAIPYRSLEATAPKPGQAWSFSVVRNGTHEYPAAATFVPVYRAYHEPHRFALLVFRSSTDSNAIKGPIQ